jgi:hypothetical protein
VAQLPEVRGAPRDRLPGKPSPPPRRTRGGGDAFRDFLRRLVEHEKLHPVLEEWEVRYAAIGAVACLAVGAIGTQLPSPESVSEGSFDLFGIVAQELTFAEGLLADLVSALEAVQWPLLAIGALGLALAAYFAVRPRQPIGLHYVCAVQMLLGFLAGLALLAIFGLLLANVVIGLFTAVLLAIVGIFLVAFVMVFLAGLARF